jgi:hypothetical protein
MIQARIALDRLKMRINLSKRIYALLKRARIRAIFHPDARMRSHWKIVFACARLRCFVVLIADYQMVSYNYNHAIF